MSEAVKDYVPRPYQAEGEERIVTTPGFGYFVEPGGGKTVTAWTAADRLMNDCLAIDQCLITGPKMVCQEVWWREAAKWRHTAHLDVKLITAADFEYHQKIERTAVFEIEMPDGTVFPSGSKIPPEAILPDGAEIVRRVTLKPRSQAETRKSILDAPQRFHVVSRDHLHWLAKLMKHHWPYQLMIGDESTSYKTHDSKRSRAVKWLRDKGWLARLLLMSGTPSPKSLEQLWAQVRLLDGGERLGDTLTEFRHRFMVPDKRSRERIFNYKPAAGAVEAVTALISDICMSVRADVWRQNEPLRTVQRRLTLSDEAIGIYNRMERDSIMHLPETVIASQAATLHGKLCQIASGTVFDTEKDWHEIHTAKLDDLEELVEELDGEPLVVLYWFQPNLARLRKRFPGLATIKTPGFLDKFAAGKIPLLAINPASAGHGLDGLQHGGHHVYVFDVISDYEFYKQAIDRLDRSGQRHQVTVHQAIAAGTVDEEVAVTLATRGADQGQVLDAIKGRWERVRRQATSLR